MPTTTQSAADTGETDTKSSVVATCNSCGDEHPLGDRPKSGPTTECPHCGAWSYTSTCTGDPITKSDTERVADAVRHVEGVGTQTRENIVATFDSYYGFEAADERDLQHIDGVGRRTAERIVESQ